MQKARYILVFVAMVSLIASVCYAEGDEAEIVITDWCTCSSFDERKPDGCGCGSGDCSTAFINGEWIFWHIKYEIKDASEGVYLVKGKIRQRLPKDSEKKWEVRVKEDFWETPGTTHEWVTWDRFEPYKSTDQQEKYQIILILKNEGQDSKDKQIVKLTVGPSGVSCLDWDEDGYSINGGGCGPIDCDDTDDEVYPGAEEICDDEVDNDCDGDIDYDDSDCYE